MIYSKQEYIFFVLFVGGIILTIGDVVMKKWVITENWRYGVCGILVWLLGLCCLAATVKYQNLAVATFIIVFINIGSLAIVERLVFNNSLTAQKAVGLLLGVVGLILLETAP